jgi:hypothetical protein
MSEARREPKGRSRRTAPHTPTGMQPNTRTFWVSPMAPTSTVPTPPTRASAGVAGAVVPTPEGCHPPRNWDHTAVQPGNGVNCPMAGRRPPMMPRHPMRRMAAAATQTTVLTRLLTRPLDDSTTSSPRVAAVAVAAPSSAAANSSAWAPWNPYWKTRRP